MSRYNGTGHIYLGGENRGIFSFLAFYTFKSELVRVKLLTPTASDGTLAILVVSLAPTTLTLAPLVSCPASLGSTGWS